MKKALVSVTGVDKPGIIARVSTALYEMNVNVLEISQTILDGYFTMLMIVDVTSAAVSFAELAARLDTVGGEIGEAPPVADEASRFRGSAPIGGHDSARESVGTTVGKRAPPLRTAR